MKYILKKILPNILIKYIVNFKKYFLEEYALKSYSQEGEDMILKQMFDKFGLGKEVGFYVDVGAHHPKRYSNTYFFYKKGWKGINIDAMPGSMKTFEIIRPRDINIESPISSKKQVLTYFAFNEPALNGFSREVSEARDGLKNYKIDFTKDLETSTLEEILDENLPLNQTIDFLSIDVEGLDFDVLTSMNIKKYRPRVILVEILDFSLVNVHQDPIYKFLVYEDYTLYAKAVNTVIFKSNFF